MREWGTGRGQRTSQAVGAQHLRRWKDDLRLATECRRERTTGFGRLASTLQDLAPMARGLFTTSDQTSCASPQASLPWQVPELQEECCVLETSVNISLLDVSRA